jgi:hypothetical protein
MIYLLSATLIIVGLIIVGLGYRRQKRRPTERLLNEETLGVALILAGLWTLAGYAIVEVLRP